MSLHINKKYRLDNQFTTWTTRVWPNKKYVLLKIYPSQIYVFYRLDGLHEGHLVNGLTRPV